MGELTKVLKFKLWGDIIDEIDKLIQDPMVINHWFTNLIDVEKKKSIIYVHVYSALQAEWMDTKYSEYIVKAAKIVLEENVRVKYIVYEGTTEPYTFIPEEEEEDEDDDDLEESFLVESGFFNEFPTEEKQKNPNKLNPKYTFEAFIVGETNRFAHAAALTVSEKIATAYNPLFLYGPSGVGKTHLMHAIAHRSGQLYPNLKILYISMEEFTNEFINSIRRGEGSIFKNKYRTTDILLIDDIQFLINKKETQEEFFHTFNALSEQGKQIVITSDRSPKELATLEERLRSRFEGGLIIDVGAPDFETRVAIIQSKALAEEIHISSEAIYFIATNIVSNIRKIEGVINNLVYASRLSGIRVINLEFTKQMLSSELQDAPKEITFKLIKQTVASHYKIKVADLSSSRRDKMITQPRHLAMYLCRDLLNTSLPKIGEEFGGRDHSTVIHACEKVAKEIEANSDYAELVNKIIDELQK